MVMYSYLCPYQHEVLTERRGKSVECDKHNETAYRIWGFGMVKGDLDFEPHMNASVNEYVSSPAKFNDALKRKSDEATQRTGIPHNYTPIDPRDKAAAGVTDEAAN